MLATLSKLQDTSDDPYEILDNKPEIASNVCKIHNSIGECDPIKARHYIHHMDDCDHPESHD